MISWVSYQIQFVTSVFLDPACQLAVNTYLHGPSHQHGFFFRIPMGEIPKVKYVGSFGIYRVSHNFPEKY